MKPIWFGLVVALVATPAFAQESFSAEIASPKQPYYDTLIEGVAWRCDGVHCQTTSDLNDANDMDSCVRLARRVGKLLSFTGSKGVFDADKLAECNK